MERLSSGRLGAAFADSLRGIKHFQDFKKAYYQFKIESVKHPYLTNNKMERPSSRPLGAAFADSLRERKHFQDFKMVNFRP